MRFLAWWDFPKRAWFIILLELGIIASLSIWLYSTYLNDAYFQAYTNSLSPILIPLLSVAFGLSSASIATYLYLGMRRLQADKEPDAPRKNKARQNFTGKKMPAPPIPQSKVDNSPPAASTKLRPITSLQTRGNSRRLHPQATDTDALSNEKEKRI